MKSLKKDKDFILKGSTSRVLLSLSIPLILSNLITMLYNLADGLWLAQLSPTAFTATGFTFPIIFLFISASLGLSIGGTTLISQKLGAQKKKLASNFAKHVLIIGVLIGVTFALVGHIFTPAIITFMGAKGELYDASTDYLSIISFGFLLDAIIFSFQAILNSQGKTIKTTIIGFTSGILNIILDPFFIFAVIPGVGLAGFDFGVSGAAIATVISKSISIIIGIVFINSKDSEVNVSFKDFKYNHKITKKIFQMAIPTAIARGMTALGFTVCNVFIIKLGEEVVTAFTLINRVNALFMQISMGIGATMTAIIGQHVGAKLIDRAKIIINKGFIFSIAASAVGVIIMYLFQTDVISLFIDPNANPIITQYAREYANHTFINIPSMGLFFIYIAIFQGVGRMKTSLRFSVIRLWMIRIPLLLVFIYLTSLDQIGVWLVMSISNSVVLFYGHYKYKTDELLFKPN